MTTMKEEALLALAAKGEAEHNLANLPLCPPLRHAAFATVMAALVATPAIPLPLRFGVIALMFVSIALIVQ